MHHLKTLTLSPWKKDLLCHGKDYTLNVTSKLIIKILKNMVFGMRNLESCSLELNQKCVCLLSVACDHDISKGLYVRGFLFGM